MATTLTTDDKFLNKLAHAKTQDLHLSKLFARSMYKMVNKYGLKRIKENYPMINPLDDKNMDTEIYTVLNEVTLQETCYNLQDTVQSIIDYYSDAESTHYNKAKVSLYTVYLKSAMTLIIEHRNYINAKSLMEKVIQLESAT